MATIKEGYNSQPFTLKVSAMPGDRKAQIYSEEEGLGQLEGHVRERLHYATIEELLDLRNEINGALKVLVGVE